MALLNKISKEIQYHHDGFYIETTKRVCSNCHHRSFMNAIYDVCANIEITEEYPVWHIYVVDHGNWWKHKYEGRAYATHKAAITYKESEEQNEQ